MFTDGKGQSSFPAPNLMAKTDGEGEKPSKDSGNRDESSSDKRGKIPRRNRNCNNPSCSCWHLPVCQNYKSEKECVHNDKCHFRHVEADEKPSKKSNKGGAKGSVALLKESILLNCVCQDSLPRKSFLRGEGKLGSKHAAQFSTCTWHQIKIREMMGPSRGIIQSLRAKV